MTAIHYLFTYLFTKLFTELTTAVTTHSDPIRILLGRGPRPARQLAESLGLSQPTISRAINALGDEVVRIGTGPSIQYALRDAGRGVGNVPVYRVSTEGTIRQLGILIPVRPEGFVMVQSDGKSLFSDSLPWWLDDMRPQGYLGRNYASLRATQLGLPSQLSEWSDAHALRALLADGVDAAGNLLLGDHAKDAFLTSTPVHPVELHDKASEYVRLAEQAARGEVPGSSAGGEQPKFVSYVQTPDGPRHVIVKFTLDDHNPVTGRWRDLLLAEHLALETLNESGIPAVRTRIVDSGFQRFLEIERFDRVGVSGRKGLISMKALDAEFVGAGAAEWPTIANALAKKECITREAAAVASLLQAIGKLIGNTDMHTGNLSFVTEHGRPYDISPAYDMLPMGFAPKSGGGIPSTLPEATLHPDIPAETWIRANEVARRYLERLRNERGFSPAFLPCIDALSAHMETASSRIARLE